MAAALLSGALSFHVAVQPHAPLPERPADSPPAPSIASVSGSCRGSSALVSGFGGGKTGSPTSSRLSSCMPLFLSADNPFRQRTRAGLLQRGRNRVRVASLKDSQREVLHEVDEQSTPIELGSPPSPTGSSENGSEGEDAHSSESPEEVVDFLKAKADDEGASLKEEVKAEGGVSGTVKGTIVATVLLLACLGAFGGLSFVFKEQINELLTQFSDLLEG